MERINFNSLSNEELRGMERKAWSGVLDYNQFPAPEYKFFDTVAALGMRHRHENFPAELLRDDIENAREIYRKEREQLTYNLEAQRKYQSAIMRADELRIAINKANSTEEKLRFALECIELLTGENGFAPRNLKGEHS
ncbi:MAG: hypothetical protein J1F09_01855 [Oscillospiraceae bacterium]|nr:hypothetical protein [Oscillospiraceae bacterium]